MNDALRGKHIVNTRAVHQAERLNTALRACGALPLDYPCIAILPPEDPAPLDAALGDLCAGHFDWLVLTSANTVYALSECLVRDAGTGRLWPKSPLVPLPTSPSVGEEEESHRRAFPPPRPLRARGNEGVRNFPFHTAAVGKTTAEAARTRLGVEHIELPPRHDAGALTEYLPLKRGEQVLLPQSALAGPALAEALTARGALVRAVEAYRTVRGQGGADIPHDMAQNRIDALTFTSPSTVTGFLERLHSEGGQIDRALALPAACIGQSTAAAAVERGFMRVCAPSNHSLEGLIQALEHCFTEGFPR